MCSKLTRILACRRVIATPFSALAGRRKFSNAYRICRMRHSKCLFFESENGLRARRKLIVCVTQKRGTSRPRLWSWVWQSLQCCFRWIRKNPWLCCAHHIRRKQEPQLKGPLGQVDATFFQPFDLPSRVKLMKQRNRVRFSPLKIKDTFERIVSVECSISFFITRLCGRTRSPLRASVLPRPRRSGVEGSGEGRPHSGEHQ